MGKPVLKTNFINRFVEHPRVDQTIKFLSIVIGVAGIAYFFWKNLFIRWEDVDFKVIWLSGHLWFEGISPYSPGFSDLGQEMFGTFNGHPFYYPPHFWFVSSFFALLNYEVGIEVWRWLNIGLFLFSSVILKSAMEGAGVNLSWRQIIFYTGLIGFMQAVILIFHIGQTTILIYFGICVTIFGALKSNNVFLIIGFCIILLKPQIGVPLVAAFLPFKEYRRSIAITCVLMFALSLPGTQPIGLIDTISAYIDGAAVHGDFYSNQPKMTTGIRNLVYLISNYEMSSTIAALASIAAVFAAALFVRQEKQASCAISNADTKILTLMISISVIAAVSPLHTYDFVFLAPIIILSWKFGNPFQTYIFVIFLLILRHDNVTRETGFFYKEGETLVGFELVTLASLALLVTVIIYLKNISAIVKSDDR